VFTTHLSFELGVASTIAPVNFDHTEPSDAEYEHLEEVGFEQVFMEAMDTIVEMDMYTEFSRQGWTRHIVREARDVLMPIIIKTVTMGWYQAVRDAEAQS
jgi:hypothetical protein